MYSDARFERERYIVIQSAGSRVDLYDFERWCEKHKLPLVVGKTKGKFCRAEMDLIFAREGTEDSRFVLDAKGFEISASAFDTVALKRSTMQTLPGDIYYHVENIPTQHVNLFCQLYVALYKRQAGEDWVLPVFSTPTAESLWYWEMETTKKRLYTYIKQDGSWGWMGHRWRIYCAAHGIPWIQVWEKRKGHGVLLYDFSTAHSLSDEELNYLTFLLNTTGINHKKGIDARRYIAFNKETCTYWDQMGKIPVVLDIAEKFVSMLRDHGYFSHDPNSLMVPFK